MLDPMGPVRTPQAQPDCVGASSHVRYHTLIVFCWILVSSPPALTFPYEPDDVIHLVLHMLLLLSCFYAVLQNGTDAR